MGVKKLDAAAQPALTLADLSARRESQSPLSEVDSDLKPTIAVVIIARNAAGTLADALHSLVLQEVAADQIIVVDNNSTDGTADVARSVAANLDQPIVVRHAEVANLSALRNIGNRLATTDYIAVLDADDIYSPSALRSYLAAIQSAGWPDVLYGDCEYFGSGAVGIKRYPRFSSSGAFMAAIMARPVVPFKHSCVIYRRAAWQAIGGYDERYPRQIDIALMLRFLSHGMRAVKVDGVIARHRRHEGQATRARLASLQRWNGLIDEFEAVMWRRWCFKALRFSAEILKRLVRG